MGDAVPAASTDFMFYYCICIPASRIDSIRRYSLKVMHMKAVWREAALIYFGTGGGMWARAKYLLPVEGIVVATIFASKFVPRLLFPGDNSIDS
jgi:hypothetical protein